MAVTYKLIWGHPVPWSLTVQRPNGITYSRIPPKVLAAVAAELAEMGGYRIDRIEDGYVFYSDGRSGINWGNLGKTAINIENERAMR